MASTLGQRLAPFLDVLGALLIFGSWLASNVLLQRAQSQTSTHEAIVERIHQFRLYDNFAGRTRDIQTELARTRELVQSSARDARSSESETDATRDTPRWTGMTVTQVRNLRGLVDDLEGYSMKLSESEAPARSVTALREGAEKLSQEFGSARDEYEQLLKRTESSGDAGEEAAAREALQGRIDALWQAYEAAKERLLESGDERLEVAARRAASANLLAARSKQLSYAMYALGTLLILYGRARTALGAKARASG